MENRLVEAQNVFLDKINPICKRFGLNHIMAQLYIILYFSDKALSLDEMAERLNISKGSVSTNIRALERYGAVRRVFVRGSRKDYYEPESDITKVILQRIQGMAGDRVSEIDEIINTSYRALESTGSDSQEDKDTLEAFKTKLDKLKTLYEQARAMFDLFNATFLSKKLGPAPSDTGAKIA